MIRHLIVSAVLSLLFSVSVPVFAVPNPEGVLTRIGDFPLIDYQPHGDVYELRNHRPVNQEQSQECFLFAYTNAIQVANINVFGRFQSPQISSAYLFSQKLLDVINESLETGDSKMYLEGGNVEDAIALTIKFGFVPQSVWKPKVPFHEWPFETLYKEIEKAIKAERRKLQKLANSHGAESQEYMLALLDSKAKVSEMVTDYSGKLPESFSWKGEVWTPKAFAAVYGIEQASRVEMHLPPGALSELNKKALRRQMNSLLNPFGATFSLYHKDWPQVEERMKAAIDEGVPVLVGMHWGRTGHVLTAVGYEIRSEKIYAWKFLNSWGDWADGGEAFFKASDLRKKADQIWLIQ